MLIIAALIVTLAYWRRAATEMAVTNRRVVVKRGALPRRSIEVMLGNIESIAVDQTLTGRTFDFGTIVLRGKGGTLEVFAHIAHPLEVHRQVQEQIDSPHRSRLVVASVS